VPIYYAAVFLELRNTNFNHNRNRDLWPSSCFRFHAFCFRARNPYGTDGQTDGQDF